MVNALHPGFVDTELFRKVDAGWFTRTIMGFARKTVAMNPKDGALTTLYVATSKEIEEKKLTGKYFEPYGKIEAGSKWANDAQLQVMLWKWSEGVLTDVVGETAWKGDFKPEVAASSSSAAPVEQPQQQSEEIVGEAEETIIN